MSAAISFVSGKGALTHNNREYIHKNIDKERIENNINYKEEKLEYAYEKCFSEALEKYNKKQTRNDRKIKNYMKQIKDSGNNEKLFYENVVQVGDKYTHGFGSGNEKQAIDILDQYAKNFQQRNPNLYVFNMKMHLDEATPHLHIDYIPVAIGYKRGLETRNSLTKAHENMGIGKSTGRNNNSTMKWQDRERAYIKQIAKEHGLEIVNKHTDRKHLTVDEYKIYAEEVEKQYNRFVHLKINSKASKVPFTDKVIMNNADFKKLIDNSKYNYIADKAMKQYTDKLEKKEIELNNLADNLKEKSMDFNVNIKDLAEMRSEEKENIQEIKAKYIKLYNKQENLNEINRSLERQNKILKTEIEKINPLEQRADDLAHNLMNVMQAVNMFLYDEKDNYKLKDLTKKQKCLIEALEDYSKSWLEQVGRKDLSEKVENHIGLSKGIKESIQNINKLYKKQERSLDIGGR